ncbi:MAG: energy transducer TonB [Bacteroidales bacterium]|jgi:protein TonB|nr:energy transducer TonB [Bacteroidales bacterium]
MIQKKSAKGDLEGKRGTFLALGLVLVLGLVYFGLELFATQDSGPGYVMADEEVIMVMEEDVLATDAPPPEPPQQQQQQEAIIEIVDDNTIVDDNWDLFNQEFDEDEVVNDIQQVEIVEAVVEEIPVRYAQNPAEFPGGTEELYKFLYANTRYPETAVQLNLNGTVIVEFVVEKDGKPSNAKITMSTAEIFNAEAIRIISIMPKWKPAVHNGQTVRSYFQLPITFTLSN